MCDDAVIRTRCPAVFWWVEAASAHEKRLLTGQDIVGLEQVAVRSVDRDANHIAGLRAKRKGPKSASYTNLPLPTKRRGANRVVT